MLSYQLGRSQHPLVVDLNKSYLNDKNELFELETKNSIDTISKQISNNLTVEKIYPETIKFSVKNQKSKIVPVMLKALLSYEKPFQLNGNIKLTPSTIVVKGDSAELAQIEYLETENIILKNLNISTTKNIKVKIPNNLPSVSSSLNSIILNIPIEKFTEASLNIPIRGDNAPKGFLIKTIPDHVKITYIVALSNYTNIKEDMFLVVGDYLKTKKENNDKLKLEIIKTPQFIRNVKLNLEKVDFILKKI